MCGRYYVDDEIAREIEKLVRDAGAKLCNLGEVCPSQVAAVIHGTNNTLTASNMWWGFPQVQKSRLLINARAETILQRPAFRESTLHRRCIIPASGYFEWNRQREKVTFRRPDTILYMAGIYNLFQGQERFVVITTAANDSVKNIHDRMPLILEKEEWSNWILDNNSINYILGKQTPLLERRQEYQQQCLF
jgi:putative SOS response-associated peptidase YedK